MNEIIELYSTIKNYSNTMMDKYSRGGIHSSFIPSDYLNKGDYISTGDTIILKNMILPCWVQFKSQGQNIKLIFINCRFLNGALIDFSLANSNNKVGFFNCTFSGNITIKADALGLYECKFQDKDTSVSIETSKTTIENNTLKNGTIKIISDETSILDSKVNLESLSITGKNLNITSHSQCYKIEARNKNLKVENIVTNAKAKTKTLILPRNNN